MAVWATKRRALYLGVFIMLLILFVGLPIFFYFYDAPTCTDGKKNGDEDGVDCGGSCSLVCSFQTVDPTVKWARFFEVAPGVYSAVALIENTNFNVEAFSVPYIFKIRDERNILIYERKGNAYIAPKIIFPIFETGIVTGSRVPARVFFEFTKVPEWTSSGEREKSLFVLDRLLEGTSTTPRLTATLENRGLQSLADIAVVAILSGVDGNALAASRTFIDFLAGESSVPIVFTWPAPFEVSVATIDIIPTPIPSR